MRTRVTMRWLALAVLAGVSGACGGSASDGLVSNTLDVGADRTLVDASFDAAPDPVPDAARDAAPDRDSRADGLETGPDTSRPDAILDAPTESAGDAVDAASDGDTVAETGPDADAGCATPFDTAGCAAAGPGGGTCLPDASGHLACAPAGVVALGAACTVGAVDAALGCAPGLACVEGACATPCHRADPACPAPAWCRGAFPGAPELGACFARACTPYQPGSCGAPDLSCLPAADGTGSCQPAGAKGAGESCGTGVGLCADGLACLLEGPAGGRCVPFCDPTALAGEPAACADAGLACVDLGIAAFGLCLGACDPWGSAPCADGMTCAPTGPGAGACYTAGAAAVGAPCAKAGAWWACAPGALCVAPAADAQALCERTCRPFGPADDCPAPGAFCALRKTWLGTCQTGALDLAAGAPCAQAGAWCGPNVRCTDLGGGPTCLAYCRMDTPGDCPAGASCLQTYGADPSLGICW